MNIETEKLEDVRRWTGEKLIPRRVTIETVFGCNAKCYMCVIDYPTSRKKGIMKPALFKKIVDELAPYNKHIEMFDLFGLGEPLLDPYIFERIQYVKKKGFRNLAISTNADILTTNKQRALLETAIETVLFSIDGVNKETHESTRRGVSFERVVANVESIINMRNTFDYKTRFIIRFIRQQKNQNEWEEFRSFWDSKLSRVKGDCIMSYDMHSWGGEIASKDQILEGKSRDFEIERKHCHHIFYNLIILAGGAVPLCSEDFLRAQYNFGNINSASLLEIYNSKKFNDIRKIHIAGNKNMINPCRECTVLYSEASRSQF